MTTPWEVSGPLKTRFSSIRVVAETGSTNKDLLDAARDGEAEGSVLVTGHQTAGRGRQGRVWVDEPESSLLCSILLRPDVAWAPLIPLVTGVALVRAVRHQADLRPGFRVGLKWPNDVLVADQDRERKMAGILAEATSIPGPASEGGGLVVVVGFGVNLRFSQPPEGEVADRAIDLASAAVAAVDRLDLLGSALVELESLLVQLEEGNRDLVLETYRSHCLTLGRTLRFQTGPVDKPVEIRGSAIDIDPGGGLVLETSDGSRQILTAGDAHHLG